MMHAVDIASSNANNANLKIMQISEQTELITILYPQTLQ